jgi:hypothetical protein
MVTTIGTYQFLLEKLREARKLGFEDQEDAILDEMDVVWLKLTQKEIDIINCRARRIYIKIIGSEGKRDSRDKKNLFFVFDVDTESDIWPQVERCIEQSKQLTIKEAMLCDAATPYYGTVTKENL